MKDRRQRNYENTLKAYRTAVRFREKLDHSEQREAPELSTRMNELQKMLTQPADEFAN